MQFLAFWLPTAIEAFALCWFVNIFVNDLYADQNIFVIEAATKLSMRFSACKTNLSSLSSVFLCAHFSDRASVVSYMVFI